jgi:hypothetical protein
MRRTILRPALTELRANEIAHLGLHQLLRHKPHALTDHVRVIIKQHLPDDLLDRHPVHSGHRRPPSLSEL